MELNYDEILKCYEGETEQQANTSLEFGLMNDTYCCLLYTSPSPRDRTR